MTSACIDIDVHLLSELADAVAKSSMTQYRQTSDGTLLSNIATLLILISP
jgi:hypothetical protein